MYIVLDEFGRTRFSQHNIAGCKSITSEKAVLMTIWYLANTESFRQIADRFGISLSSAYRCLVRVVNFLVDKRKEYIKWPSQVEAQRIAAELKKNKILITLLVLSMVVTLELISQDTIKIHTLIERVIIAFCYKLW